MRLEGKDLVSNDTARSARILMTAALVVLLGKLYGVLPVEIDVLGVTISEAVVQGGVFWALFFQILNHVVHWFGDFRGQFAWNTGSKKNGVSRWDIGAKQLTALDAVIERVDVFLRAREDSPTFEKSYPDHVAAELKSIREELDELKPSITKLQTYAGFYFYVWYLILPIGIGAAALFWPEGTV